MAITLNGSTGISSPGGDTSTSLSTGLLTVTGSTVPANGMYLPTTNTLAWATNSTERMRLDSSGNLGLGVTPSAWRSVYKAVQTNGGAFYGFTSNDRVGMVQNGYVDSTSLAWTYTTSATASRYDQISGVHAWYTAASGTAGNTISFTQAMTLDASGNLLVGKTAYTSVSTDGCTFSPLGYVQTSFTSSPAAYFNRNGTDGNLVNFFKSGTSVGSISVTGSATAYNTSSDQRLKKNIVDAPGALSSVNAIKVRSFDWKADGSHVDYGYIAQELLEVVPEAVSVPADPEEMMGVDFGKLTPRIIKAIQELTARLEALEGAH